MKKIIVIIVFILMIGIIIGVYKYQIDKINNDLQDFNSGDVQNEINIVDKFIEKETIWENKDLMPIRRNSRNL